MNSIINTMPKYDHRQHVLSDCLTELDQRFQLGQSRRGHQQDYMMPTPHRRHRVRHPIQPR